MTKKMLTIIKLGIIFVQIIVWVFIHETWIWLIILYLVLTVLEFFSKKAEDKIKKKKKKK